MKTNKPTHTPTPWALNSGTNGAVRSLHKWVGNVCRTICTFPDRELNESSQMEADAAFIVRAVNVHDEMLMALKLLHDVLENNSIIDWEANSHLTIARRNAYKAIIKAEGDKV